MKDNDFMSSVKLQALQIRRSLEEHSTALWASFTGDPIEEVWVSHVVSRLHLVLGKLPVHERRSALTTVRKAAITYKETSDVLHARMRGAHLTEARLEEWRAAVEDFDVLMVMPARSA